MKINKSKITIYPDRTRVLLRPFFPLKVEAAQRIVNSVLALDESAVLEIYGNVLKDFVHRHENIEEILQNRFYQIGEILDIKNNISSHRKSLIGSYFLMEYSPESAALFNPSVIQHPDQRGIKKGSMRFILSLRATGEGHISSITFRSGIIDKKNSIKLDSPVPFTLLAKRISNRGYDKDLFLRKLKETGVHDDFSLTVLSSLHDVFFFDELKEVLLRERSKFNVADLSADRSCQAITLLAESNYEVHFNPESKLSQRILFPSGPTQSNGIEDARFVRFVDDDGTAVYYATYTAYDGKVTLPQMVETNDFFYFKFATLNGPAISNKGMALFPKKINGMYAMLSRQDDENIFVIYSDNIHFWYSPKLILSPRNPWEYMKIGTCGSPIETKYGWLVISHGVGPVRKYSIGAFLLDLNDPSKVIGRLMQPFLFPTERERDGYVPNVVYSCGSMLHGEHLFIPYAVSDYATKFATVKLDEIIQRME